MDPDLADRIYELDRCIECGCCVAACGTARMRKDFVGAVGLNRVARFRLDPRDARTDDDYYDVIGDDDGVFGCMSLLACHDVCPKDLPLATQIAFMRRKMARSAWQIAEGDAASRGAEAIHTSRTAPVAAVRFPRLAQNSAAAWPCGDFATTGRRIEPPPADAREGATPWQPESKRTFSATRKFPDDAYYGVQTLRGQGEFPHHGHPDVAGAQLRQGIRLREEGGGARQPRPRRARRARSPTRSPARATG